MDLVRINQNKDHSFDLKAYIQNMSNATDAEREQAVKGLEFDIHVREMERDLYGGTLDQGHERAIQILNDAKTIISSAKSPASAPPASAPPASAPPASAPPASAPPQPAPPQPAPPQPAPPASEPPTSAPPQPAPPAHAVATSTAQYEGDQWIRFYATRDLEDPKKIHHTAWLKYKDGSMKIFSVELSPVWRRLNVPVWIPKSSYMVKDKRIFIQIITRWEGSNEYPEYLRQVWLGETCAIHVHADQSEILQNAISTLHEQFTSFCIGTFLFEPTEETPRNHDPFFVVKMNPLKESVEPSEYREAIILTSCLSTDYEYSFEFPTLQDKHVDALRRIMNDDLRTTIQSVQMTPTKYYMALHMRDYTAANIIKEFPLLRNTVQEMLQLYTSDPRKLQSKLNALYIASTAEYF